MSAIRAICLSFLLMLVSAILPATPAFAQSAPTITSVTPDKGPDSGGTTVTITGTNFTNVQSVAFGGTLAAYTVDSATQITAVTPSRSAGDVDVEVTTQSGTATRSGGFSFRYAPTVTNVSISHVSSAGGGLPF